jgi:hypothetical protein
MLNEFSKSMECLSFLHGSANLRRHNISRGRSLRYKPPYMNEELSIA